MSTDLRPIDAPDLQPLRNSFEYDQLESEIKDAFMTVFENYIRPYERQVNLSGMPHLGGTDLIERTLKDYGLAIVRRDATRTAFLLKAARSRNPRRGMIFLKQYLQSVWPGVWKVDPLWHPIATADHYPDGCTPLSTVTLDANTKAVFNPDSPESPLNVYRTDWQGTTLMYPTARTNLCNQSDVRSNAGWNIGAKTAVVKNATLVGPDGVSPASSYAHNGTPGNQYVSLASPPVMKANTWYTVTVWMRLVNGVAPTTGNAITVDYGGAGGVTMRTQAAFTAANKLTAAWQKYSVTFFNITAGQFSCYANTDTGSTAEFSPWGYQYEESQAPTRLIRTTGAVASYTDFTMAANGLATFTDGLTPVSPLVYFLTGRIRITLPVSTDNGLGLVEIAKAFRSTLAARLMLELELSIVFESLGAASNGLSLAGGAKGVMPFLAIGTLTR